MSERPEGSEDGRLRFMASKPNVSCDGIWSMEGVFTRELDGDRVRNLLNILGPVEQDETGAYILEGTTLFMEGSAAVRGSSVKEIKERARNVEHLVARAMECIGCGSCVPHCSMGAIYLDVQAWIDEERCEHCAECLEAKCPVTEYDGK